MKQQFIVSVIIACMLAPASAFAQGGPALREAVRVSAAHTPLQPPATSAPHEGNRYFWPGLVMMGGGAGLAVIAATAAKKETCGVVAIGYTAAAACVEETNKPLLWVGIGAAAGGATLMAIGGAHHQVAVGPSSVRYRFRF